MNTNGNRMPRCLHSTEHTDIRHLKGSISRLLYIAGWMMWRMWSEPGATCHQTYVRCSGHNCMLIHGFSGLFLTNIIIFKCIGQYISAQYSCGFNKSHVIPLCCSYFLFLNTDSGHCYSFQSVLRYIGNLHGEGSHPLCLWEALIVKHWFRRLQVWPTAPSSATKEAQEERECWLWRDSAVALRSYCCGINT